MKQIYLLFLVLFSKNMMQAQPVFPTYEEEPVWCVVYNGFPPGENFYYNLKLNPDTFICDKFYTPIIAKDYPVNILGDTMI